MNNAHAALETSPNFTTKDKKRPARRSAVNERMAWMALRYAFSSQCFDSNSSCLLTVPSRSPCSIARRRHEHRRLVDAGLTKVETSAEHISNDLRKNLNLTPDQRRLTLNGVANLTEDTGPSFSCRVARSLELAICSNAELAAADAKLSALYQRNLADAPESVAADQRDWLHMRDAICTSTNVADTVPCLLGQYRARIKVLQYSSEPSMVR